MPRDVLPSMSPDGYKSQPLPFSRERIDQAAGLVGDYYRDKSTDEKRDNPMLPAEVLVVEGILRYIDYCLPPGPYRNPASQAAVRRSRVVGRNVLTACDEVEIQLEDLQQEARLAAIRAIRSFDADYSSEHSVSALTLIPFAVVNHFTKIGSKAIRGGFTSKGYTQPTELEPLSVVARNAFAKPVEAGWSDSLNELREHPIYRRKVELATIEESGDGDQTESTPPFHPVGYIGEILGLDDLFTLMELHDVVLDDRTKSFLRLRYIDDLSPEEIGKMQKKPITKQAVSQAILRALRTIQETPSLLVAFSDLYNILD